MPKVCKYVLLASFNSCCSTRFPRKRKGSSHMHFEHSCPQSSQPRLLFSLESWRALRRGVQSGWDKLVLIFALTPTIPNGTGAKAVPRWSGEGADFSEMSIALDAPLTELQKRVTARRCGECTRHWFTSILPGPTRRCILPRDRNTGGNQHRVGKEGQLPLS